MSVSRKVFVVVSVIVAVVASTFGTVGYVRQSKRQSTAEQWLRLLTGPSQNKQVEQGTTVKAGPSAEIIGRAGYPLYK